MNAPSHPVQAAADVLLMLEQADLPALKKRDMISAVRRICVMAGCSPASLRLEVPALRGRLATILPAAHGITPKTFANLRSLFVKTLEWAGVIERLQRGAARQHEAWAPLIATIAADKALSKGLASFTNWCATNGIRPIDVSDATLRQFGDWLENRTLHARQRDLLRQIPRLWNLACRDVPGWPQQELTRNQLPSSFGQSELGRPALGPADRGGGLSPDASRARPVRYRFKRADAPAGRFHSPAAEGPHPLGDFSPGAAGSPSR